VAFAVAPPPHDPDVGVVPEVEHPVQLVDDMHDEHPAGHEFEQLAGTGMVYPVLQPVQNPELRPMKQFLSENDPETHVPAWVK